MKEVIEAQAVDLNGATTSNVKVQCLLREAMRELARGQVDLLGAKFYNHELRERVEEGELPADVNEVFADLVAERGVQFGRDVLTNLVKDGKLELPDGDSTALRYVKDLKAEDLVYVHRRWERGEAVGFDAMVEGTGGIVIKAVKTKSSSVAPQAAAPEPATEAKKTIATGARVDMKREDVVFEDTEERGRLMVLDGKRLVVIESTVDLDPKLALVWEATLKDGVLWVGPMSAGSIVVMPDGREVTVTGTRLDRDEPGAKVVVVVKPVYEKGGEEEHWEFFPPKPSTMQCLGDAEEFRRDPEAVIHALEEKVAIAEAARLIRVEYTRLEDYFAFCAEAAGDDDGLPRG